MRMSVNHTVLVFLYTVLLSCCGNHSMMMSVWSLSSSSTSFSSSSSSSGTTTTSGSGYTPPPTSSSSSSRGVVVGVTSINRDELGLKQFPRTWVPIASTYELDPDRPTPIQFLGQTYITYQDNSQNWIVMDDTCPHRLAPLSEGRIDRETDTIECSYHGWAFKGTSSDDDSDGHKAAGSCVRIPQSTSSIADAAMSSSKSCVATYPTHIEQGVVWMWPWPEDVLTVAGNVSASPEGMMTLNLNHNAESTVSTYTRDLPYSWDILIENLIDPSHVPFAHHGLQGKRTDAIPINMTVPSKVTEAGFTFTFGDRTMGMRRLGTGEFRAPYSVIYQAQFETKPPRPFELTALCIPTKPGWSRVIVISRSGTTSTMKTENDDEDDKDKEEGGTITKKTTTKEKTTKMKNKKKTKKTMFARIFSIIPPWGIHQLSNVFFDSDMTFLHYQERERQRRPEYFMPAPADRCISSLQQWFTKHVPNLKDDPAFQPLPISPTSRLELFDRYGQHTSHCKLCQTGLKSIQQWRRRTYAALAISLLSGYRFIVARVAVMICLAIFPALNKLESNFRQGDYKHYEK